MGLYSLHRPASQHPRPRGATTPSGWKCVSRSLTNGDLEKIRSIGHTEDRFDTKTLDFTYDVGRGAASMPDMLDRLSASARKRPSRAATTSSCFPTARSAGSHRHPGAGDRRCAPPPDPQGSQNLGRPRRRNRRAARSATSACSRGYGAERSTISPSIRCSTCMPRASSKEVDASKSSTATSRRSWEHPQGHVEDGHLDLSVLLRQPDLRCDRPAAGLVDKYFFGTATMIEGVDLKGDLGRDRCPPHVGLWQGPCWRPRSISAANMPTACAAACLDTGCGGHAAACRSRQCRGPLPRVCREW